MGAAETKLLGNNVIFLYANLCVTLQPGHKPGGRQMVDTYHNKLNWYRHEHFGLQFGVLVDKTGHAVQERDTHNRHQHRHIVGLANV